MALKDLKNILFIELNNLLQPHGFKLLKSKSRFVQKTSYGCNVISLRFLISYAPKFIAEVTLYNEIDYLGNIIKQFDYRVVKNKDTIQFISIVSIGDLLGYDPNHDYNNLVTEQDFYNAAHAMYNDIAKAAFEYFAMPTDPISLDQIINNNPTAEHPLLFSVFYSDFRRYCIAITLAKLANRPNFEELAIHYREALLKSKIEVTDLVMPYYDHLVKYLQETDVTTLLNLK